MAMASTDFRVVFVRENENGLDILKTIGMPLVPRIGEFVDTRFISAELVEGGQPAASITKATTVMEVNFIYHTQDEHGWFHMVVVDFVNLSVNTKPQPPAT